MEHRVTRLETAVFGWTGSNGLMGDRQKDRARLDAIESSILQVRTVIQAIRWFILSAAALLTVAGSQTIAGWIATLIQSAAAIVGD
jgi:hypothetical protein